ncbi:MAG: hypothetical protein CMJ50_05545 [Planctomycetaceae bacterium]|nr:hypothetical protein [Planctomycetaceae bacterium]
MNDRPTATNCAVSAAWTSGVCLRLDKSLRPPRMRAMPLDLPHETTKPWHETNVSLNLGNFSQFLATWKRGKWRPTKPPLRGE